MTVRTRTKGKQVGGGGTMNGYISDTLVASSTQSSHFGQKSVCTDVGDEPGHDHDLTIDKIINGVTAWSGVANPGPGRFEVQNWYPDNDAITNPQHLDVEHPLSNGQCATTILAKSNPGRYSMNGPVSLLELREIPSLIKGFGDNIIENAAGATLRWQFGFAPLISDVKKLLDFQGSVNRKMKDLMKFYDKGGKKARMNFGSASDASDQAFNAYSWQGANGSMSMTVSTTVSKWATVRWKPASTPPIDESAYRSLAIKTVYGLDVSMSNAWEAIPWSWLVDWFTNIGEYYSINAGVIPMVHTTPCIMTRYYTTRQFNTKHANGMSGGAGQSSRETKIRSITGPTISASLPLFTGRQLSILGSLAVLKKI